MVQEAGQGGWTASTILTTQGALYTPADHTVQQPVYLLQTAATPAIQDSQFWGKQQN